MIKGLVTRADNHISRGMRSGSSRIWDLGFRITAALSLIASRRKPLFFRHNFFSNIVLFVRHVIECNLGHAPRIGIVVAASLIGSGCMPNAASSSPVVKITSASVSATGEQVAFSFEDRLSGKLQKRLGLLTVGTGDIRILDQPDNLFWGSPVISPDGRRLAFTSFCAMTCSPEEFGYHLGVLDLDSGAYRLLTSNGRDEMRLSPSFAPDGRSVYFTSTEVEWNKEGGSRPKWFFGLSSIQIDSGHETQLLPNSAAPTRFQVLERTTVTTRGDILFTGTAPFGGHAESDARKSGKGRSYDFAYRLAPGGILENFPPLKEYRASSLSASADGETVAFISRSSSSTAGGGFGYDLFLYTAGVVRRVTELETYAYTTDISADGSRIVFLADDSREMNWSVWLHRLDDSSTTEILTSKQIAEVLIPEPAVGDGGVNAPDDM